MPYGIHVHLPLINTIAIRFSEERWHTAYRIWLIMKTIVQPFVESSQVHPSVAIPAFVFGDKEKNTMTYSGFPGPDW